MLLSLWYSKKAMYLPLTIIRNIEKEPPSLSTDSGMLEVDWFTAFSRESPLALLSSTKMCGRKFALRSPDSVYFSTNLSGLFISGTRYWGTLLHPLSWGKIRPKIREIALSTSDSLWSVSKILTASLMIGLFMYVSGFSVAGRRDRRGADIVALAGWLRELVTWWSGWMVVKRMMLRGRLVKWWKDGRMMCWVGSLVKWWSKLWWRLSRRNEGYLYFYSVPGNS